MTWTSWLVFLARDGNFFLYFIVHASNFVYVEYGAAASAAAQSAHAVVIYATSCGHRRGVDSSWGLECKERVYMTYAQYVLQMYVW